MNEATPVSNIEPDKNALTSSALPAKASRAIDIDPIANVDYIVDHYAILGVENTASEAEIKSAYRAKLLEWHSDRFANAPETLKQQAARKVQLFTDANEILSDQAKRDEYDTLLKSFNPRLISKDGTPILSLSARRVQVERLIAGEERDLEEKKAMARQMSGHSDAMFNIIAQGFIATPTDPAIRAAYREALEKKLVYFTVLEDIGWEEAGVANQPEPKFIADTETYLDERQAQVESTRTEIETMVDLKLLQLTRGEAPLLLTAGEGQVSANDLEERGAEIRENLQRAAKESFEKHTDKVLELAKNRAKVIDELLTHFSDYKYLTTESEKLNELLIVLNQGGKLGISLQFKINGSNVEMNSHKLPYLSKIEDLSKAESLDTLKQNFPNNAIAVLTLNPELDTLIQAGHVVKKHTELLKKAAAE